MKNSIFISLFVICSLLSGICEAQSQFQRTIGVPNDDVAYCVIQTTDGGYALAGYMSFGVNDNNFYIVKLDGSGTLQWSRTVGGTGSESASSIIQTTDGGYAVAGTANSFGAGNSDMYIVKLDASGTLQWSKTVGHSGSESASSIIQTTDGGYAVAGTTYSFGTGFSDMYIVKLDASGTLQWSKTVGGQFSEGASSIIQTTDGGYAVAGSTGTMSNYYIVKLDSSGTLQWSRTVSGEIGNVEAYSIIQTTDGGYAVAGTINYGPPHGVYIVKLNSSGALQWSKTVGGTGGYYNEAYSIIQTADGGYAVAGFTDSFGAGFTDMYIVKIDASSNLQWSRTVGGAGEDEAYSIIQTTDGGYAVAGSTKSYGAGNYDFYIVKLDAGGNTCGNMTSPSSLSGSGGTLGSQNSFVNSQAPTVTAPSPTTGSGGTLTTLCIIGINPISNEVPIHFSLSQNYPNPFNPTTKIRFALPKSSFAKLVIYDALGREVETIVSEQLNAGTYEADWSANKFSSGVYYYKLVAEEYTETRRMVLIK